MKTLLLLRHAKSSWKHPELADHDRPLNKRGRRDAPRMGDLLNDMGLVPDLIVSSTAARARSTAEAVAERCANAGPLHLTHDLYHADPATGLEVVREYARDETSVMWVGHNPGLEWCLHLLTGRDDAMPTAALAHVQLDIAEWPDLDESAEGELAQLWLPRELP